MTYEEYMAARQLLAEQKVGRAQRAAAAAEDDEFEAAAKALGR